MHKRLMKAGLAGAALVLLGGGSLIALAHDDGGDRARSRFVVSAKLQGFQEVPLSLSTTGTGRFWALVDTKANTITYKLSYDALEGSVVQAHVHFGAKHTAGGVSFFLCTNAGNGPAGTQLCPAAPGEVTGVITPAQVIGPAGQGIAAEQFAEIAAAMREGVAYANVHSTLYPAGEIRGQLN